MLYEPLLHIVLYQPEIPPNTGNIGRTCVAIGAKLWLIEPLAAHRAWFFTKTATRPYTSITFQKGDILVFGSESSGLPPEILQQFSSQAVRVPMRPEVRSLNLSATVAAAAYEAVRQIQPPIA